MDLFKYFFSGCLLFYNYTATAQTPRISFEAPFVYPEGVAWYAKGNTFFVSSVRTAAIGKVSPEGRYTLFFEDTSLKSSYGMKVDEKRNRLWVCTSDGNYSRYSTPATYKKQIRLIGLNLATGKKEADIDLSHLYKGEHFANDLVLDDAGNIYITDSYSPVIYKVDPQMQASVFAANDWFKGVDLGLNGIVWSPNGYLLVNNNSNGTLLKVDTRQPERITRIQLKTFFPGADGMLWDGNNNLLLVQNKGVNKTFQLSSTDNWQSAEVKAATTGNDRFQQPSTITVQGSKIYVMNSKLNELSDPTNPPSKQFSLQEARLIPVK